MELKGAAFASVPWVSMATSRFLPALGSEASTKQFHPSGQERRGTELRFVINWNPATNPALDPHAQQQAGTAAVDCR
jgi:hypothetical protein